jgi:hypothetical protein
MTLTWRQIDAFLEFNDKLDRIDRANQLVISTIGAQGDKQTREKYLKELVSE